MKESGLIIECPKFSKFLHGMALLYPKKLKNTPFWFLPDSEGNMTPATISELADETDKFEEVSKKPCIQLSVRNSYVCIF